MCGDSTHLCEDIMKIVVIGGTGLIGSKVVKNLQQRGHEVLAASPSSGVNAVTGEGLAEALRGAEVVVDVANSPSFEDKPVMEFFEKSGRNLASAEAAAGVKHHVALSVVGTERLLGSGYFRAKMAQEALIKESKVPYTIVRATQFFEFLGAIAQFSGNGSNVRLSNAQFQPMSAEDVAAAMTDAALAAPANGTIEIGGPERVGLADLVRRYLEKTGDPRTVVVDPAAQYFGLTIDDRSLTPEAGARLGATRFDEWVKRLPAQR
jgi:uncharacterized protein YbjT (DUF2867 family)